MDQQSYFNLTTEQRLMDQQSYIRKKQWLRNLELEEMQRKIEDEQDGNVPSDVKVKMSNGF